MEHTGMNNVKYFMNTCLSESHRVSPCSLVWIWLCLISETLAAISVRKAKISKWFCLRPRRS